MCGEGTSLLFEETAGSMYAQLDDLTMYYEEHGQQDGPPLVLLHGFTVTGRVTWDEHLDALGARHRLVVPDLRGHGLTDNPAGPPAMNHHQFARDMSAFCSEVGIERAAFCGYSAGAATSLNLALLRPQLVATAVLVSATLRIPESTRASMRSVTDLDLAYSWFGPPIDPSTPYDPASSSWHRALGHDHWRVVLRDFLALFHHIDSDDFPDPERLSEIVAPMLILHGDRDAFFPVECPVELYRLLADAELCILPQTPHELVQEQPDLFRLLVLDFLDRHRALEG